MMYLLTFTDMSNLPVVKARPPPTLVPPTPPLPEYLSLQMSAGHAMRACLARSASGGRTHTFSDTLIRTHTHTHTCSRMGGRVSGSSD